MITESGPEIDRLLDERAEASAQMSALTVYGLDEEAADERRRIVRIDRRLRALRLQRLAARGARPRNGGAA